MRSALRFYLVPLAATSLVGAAILSTAQGQTQHHTIVSADAIKWGAAPPSLPSGAQAAAILGSPAKEGQFVLYLKFPAGFVVPPHRHSKDEFVTVISGKFVITAAEKVDRAAIKALPAGSFFHLPAGTAHYAFAETEAVVQVSGMGPFDVTYLDPKDDPRKK